MTNATTPVALLQVALDMLKSQQQLHLQNISKISRSNTCNAKTNETFKLLWQSATATTTTTTITTAQQLFRYQQEQQAMIQHQHQQ
jgi:hypothetical protein